jgi:hypothetical protein
MTQKWFKLKTSSLKVTVMVVSMKCYFIIPDDITIYEKERKHANRNYDQSESLSKL